MPACRSRAVTHSVPPPHCWHADQGFWATKHAVQYGDAGHAALLASRDCPGCDRCGIVPTPRPPQGLHEMHLRRSSGASPRARSPRRGPWPWRPACRRRRYDGLASSCRNGAIRYLDTGSGGTDSLGGFRHIEVDSRRQVCLGALRSAVASRCARRYGAGGVPRAKMDTQKGP